MVFLLNRQLKYKRDLNHSQTKSRNFTDVLIYQFSTIYNLHLYLIFIK